MELYYHARICVYAYEHMKHKGRGVKVLSVVSRKGGVGETTLATTLAVEASRDGKKTVMFDLDLAGQRFLLETHPRRREPCHYRGAGGCPRRDPNSRPREALRPTLWRRLMFCPPRAREIEDAVKIISQRGA